MTPSTTNRQFRDYPQLDMLRTCPDRLKRPEGEVPSNPTDKLGAPPCNQVGKPPGIRLQGFSFGVELSAADGRRGSIFRASARKRDVLKIAIGWLSPPLPAGSVV